MRVLSVFYMQRYTLIGRNMMKRAGAIAVIASLYFFLAVAQAMAGSYGVIDHVKMKELVDAKEHNFILIDARNPEEYQEAHINGAINIPQKKFDSSLDKLPEDKATMLVFYCNGVKCGKSKKSATRAMEIGYTNVYVFAEGMPVWEELGYPFYKGDNYEKPIETAKIKPADLQVLMADKPDTVQLVDVRDPEEFEEGHIPGAINCPLQDFAMKSEILDKKKKVIVYCNSGGRSYKAYRKLVRLGYSDIGQTLFADWKEAGMKVAR